MLIIVCGHSCCKYHTYLYMYMYVVLEFRGMMSSLEKSGNDPQKIATCFLCNVRRCPFEIVSCLTTTDTVLLQAQKFKMYTHYCNNYPRYVFCNCEVMLVHSINSTEAVCV